MPVVVIDRCRGSHSAVPVEVPLLQVIDSRRHPCCGGPDSTCGVAADAVYRWSSISLLWHRGSMGKLCENCRRSQASFLASFRGELITQVMSSISLSDCCIAFTAVDIHTVEHVTKTLPWCPLLLYLSRRWPAGGHGQARRFCGARADYRSAQDLLAIPLSSYVSP